MQQKKSNGHKKRDNQSIIELNLKPLLEGRLLNKRTYNSRSDSLEPCSSFDAIHTNREVYKRALKQKGFELDFNCQGEFYSASRKKGDSALIFLTLTATSSVLEEVIAKKDDLCDYQKGVSLDELSHLPSRSLAIDQLKRLGYNEPQPVTGAIESLISVGLIYKNKGGHIVFTDAARAIALP